MTEGPGHAGGRVPGRVRRTARGRFGRRGYSTSVTLPLRKVTFMRS